MEVNKIYNEDCLQVLRNLPDKCVDLIVTDPPYLIHHGNDLKSKIGKRIGNVMSEIDGLKEGFDKSILDECWRVIKTPNMYFWCSKKQVPMYLDYFVNQKGCDFEILAWVKDNPTPVYNNHYLVDKEFCLYFRRGGTANQSTTNVQGLYSTHQSTKRRKTFGDTPLSNLPPYSKHS